MIISLVLTVFFFFAWYKLFVDIPIMQNRIVLSLNTNPDGVTENLISGNVVEQKIKPDLSYDSFSFYFAKDNVTDTCDVTVEFCDDASGKVLQSFSLNSDDLPDRSYVDFDLTNKMEKDKIYSIKIYSDNGSENNSLAVVTSSTTPQIVSREFYPLKELTVNGEDQGNTGIFLKLNSSDNSALKAIYLILSAIFGVLLIFLFYNIFVKKLKIETVFLVCCLGVGLIYMCLMTPNSIPDEPVHYFSAYKYSNAITFNSADYSSDSLINMTNKDIDVLSYSLTPGKQTYARVAEDIVAPSGDKSESPVAVMTAGNILQFLPSSIGLSLGRTLDFNGLWTYYMGRLFNLLFFVLMAYFGMKKLPFGKMVFFVIALFPITIQQAASYSYDAVINGLAFFSVGYSLYLAYTTDKIKVREIVALSVACALLSASKAGVYLPIGALIFLVFARRQNLSKKKLFAYAGTVLGSSVLLLLIFNINKILNSLLPASSSSGETAAQTSAQFYSTSFVLTNTKEFIRMFFRTLRQLKDTYYTTMVGGQLGWLNVFVGALIIALFFVLMLIAAMKYDDEKVHFNFKSRTLMLFIFIAVFGEILLAALTWTDINTSIIMGFQGRYLIPVLPLAVYCLRNSAIVIKKNIDHKLALATLMLQCITVLDVFTDRMM